MKDLLNKISLLKENKNGKVITFDFDNTIVFSHVNHDDEGELAYAQGGLNHYIIEKVISLFVNKIYCIFATLYLDIT